MNKTVHADVLVAEIGSTTTIVNAFSGINTDNPIFLGQGVWRTTASGGDVSSGLTLAVKELAASLGAANLEYDIMMAASSAAGGLRMTVHGLVADMTARAAKEAALGAGAVVRLVTSGKLTGSQLKQLSGVSPNIILLAGGLDHGERETALFNAGKLRSADLNVPVVYAGNADCRDDIREIFRGRKLYIADNVYPKVDELNTDSASAAIQQVFEEHIIHAPGMSKIREIVNGSILPTPGAVMEAAKLLYGSIGDLAVIDIGGATTDVHSVTEGSPETARIIMSPEPLAKRTVEGDLGLFVNSGNIIRQIGKDVLDTALGFETDSIIGDYSPIPETPQEFALAGYLAETAARTAVMRHAGHKKNIYGPSGRSAIAEGKDLTAVRYVIGTGGALTRLPGGMSVLKSILKIKNPAGHLLIPKEGAEFLIDRDYIMASLGVLCRLDSRSSLTLLKKSLGLNLM